MARTTKQLSGGGKDKLLRGLVAGVDGVPAAVRDALGEALISAITEVRVRRDVWEQVRHSGDPATDDSASPTPPVAAEPVEKPTRPAPLPMTAPALPAPTPDPAAFDPFAFSALTLFARQGREALAAKLGQISSPADLRALAEAQHLAVADDITAPDALRSAIIVGVERRIAERRAAAS